MKGACEACGGGGVLLVNNDSHGRRFERCDSCGRFDSDEAALEWIESLVRRLGRAPRHYYSGLLFRPADPKSEDRMKREESWLTLFCRAESWFDAEEKFGEYLKCGDYSWASQGFVLQTTSHVDPEKVDAGVVVFLSGT